MTYANYENKLEANRRWSRTPQGQEAKRRSHQRYIEKRRGLKIVELTIDPAPLAQTLEAWNGNRRQSCSA